MGKIVQGILGGVSGKVGGVIGGNWKGIDYLKGYAIPANPNTVPQQTQRGIFAAIVAFAKLVLGTVITDYWNPLAVGMSGFNAFCKANLDAWIDNTDYDNAIMAQGELESNVLSACTYTTGTGAVSASWTWLELGNGATNDTAVLVIVDTVNNVAFVDDSATRGDEGATPNIGSGRTAADLKAYLFFSSGSGDTLSVSNSDYHQVTAP